MLLSETERDRLLVFLTAELARARRRRGLRLNIVEATALGADAVCEAARDGGRLAAGSEAGPAGPPRRGGAAGAGPGGPGGPGGGGPGGGGLRRRHPAGRGARRVPGRRGRGSRGG